MDLYSTMHMVKVYNLIIVLYGLIQVILVVLVASITIIILVVIQTILIYKLLVKFQHNIALLYQIVLKEV